MKTNKFDRETERYMRRIEHTEPEWDQLAATALWALALVHRDFGEEALNTALAGIVHMIDAHADELPRPVVSRVLARDAARTPERRAYEAERLSPSGWGAR